MAANGATVTGPMQREASACRLLLEGILNISRHIKAMLKANFLPPMPDGIQSVCTSSRMLGKDREIVIRILKCPTIYSLPHYLFLYRLLIALFCVTFVITGAIVLIYSLRLKLAIPPEFVTALLATFCVLLGLFAMLGTFDHFWRMIQSVHQGSNQTDVDQATNMHTASTQYSRAGHEWGIANPGSHDKISSDEDSGADFWRRHHETELQAARAQKLSTHDLGRTQSRPPEKDDMSQHDLAHGAENSKATRNYHNLGTSFTTRGPRLPIPASLQPDLACVVEVPGLEEGAHAAFEDTLRSHPQSRGNDIHVSSSASSPPRNGLPSMSQKARKKRPANKSPMQASQPNLVQGTRLFDLDN